MWIWVYNCNNGQAITTASFTVNWFNNGDGWYYMYIGYGQNFCVSASNYYTVCGNTDSYNGMYASLCPRPVTPPPSTNCNCWS